MASPSVQAVLDNMDEAFVVENIRTGKTNVIELSEKSLNVRAQSTLLTQEQISVPYKKIAYFGTRTRPCDSICSSVGVVTGLLGGGIGALWMGPLWQQVLLAGGAGFTSGAIASAFCVNTCESEQLEIGVSGKVWTFNVSKAEDSERFYSAMKNRVDRATRRPDT